MVWNYGDDETQVRGRTVKLTVTGVPNGPAVAHRFVIDKRHSNAWTVWKVMDSPQMPSRSQYAELEKAGGLEELPVQPLRIRDGEFHSSIEMTGESVSLLVISWK